MVIGLCMQMSGGKKATPGMAMGGGLNSSSGSELKLFTSTGKEKNAALSQSSL